MKKTLFISHQTIEVFQEVPKNAKGFIVFIHGHGSSKNSQRNHFIADFLNKHGFATLLFDLDPMNLDQSALFVQKILNEISKDLSTSHLPIGLFGGSTGAAVMIRASLNSSVKALVSRGGRTDLVQEDLFKLNIPLCLIVGEKDFYVLKANQKALKSCSQAELIIIPKASHLFEEPHTLKLVAESSLSFFLRTLV